METPQKGGIPFLRVVFPNNSLAEWMAQKKSKLYIYH